MDIKKLETLKIHSLTEEQYQKAKEEGIIEETAIYLTPDDGSSGSGASREELEQLQSQVDTLSETVTANKTSTDEVIRALEESNESLSQELADTASALEEKITKNTTDITTTNQSLEELDTEVQTVKGDLTSHATSSNSQFTLVREEFAAQDTENLKTAKEYSDANKEAAVSSAKDYTDQKINELVNGTGLENVVDTIKDINEAMAESSDMMEALETANGKKVDKGAKGSTIKPIYFDENGAQEIAYTIEKSVPADAKFTDTTYTLIKDSTNKKIQLMNGDNLVSTVDDNNTTYGVATTSANGLMSSGDKTKLNGIASGAEVNQNAFSNVVVGSTTIAADAKTDTLTIVAGNNITLTPDATNDKLTIAAKDTTYSVATQSAQGLMSATDKTKLDGLATVATSGSYNDLSNKPTFTDTKVTQTESTATGTSAMPLLFRDSAYASGVASGTKYIGAINADPYLGLVRANGFIGDLTGNADTATTATTLTGLTATVDELNYSSGLTGNIQEQLDELNSLFFEGDATLLIGNNVTSVASSAYANNTFFTKVILSNNVKTIEDYAFKGCSKLASLIMGNSIESIGNQAFYSCNSLRSVYITDIAAWCNIDFYDSFSNPLSPAKNLYLNGKLITDLVIPEEVTEIKKYAFYRITAQSLTLHNNITKIGLGAFSESSLVDVILPDSIVTLEDEVFDHCSMLKTITIGKSITSIPYRTFHSCSALESIVIPTSVKSIGDYAFIYCTSLKNVYYRGTSSQWSSISKGSNNTPLTSATIHYNYTGE